MRISDWSSDVCSSDLRLVGRLGGGQRLGAPDLPVHRIVAMLQQIGRGGAVEIVPSRVDRRRIGGCGDRKSVVSGKSVSVRVDFGCSRVIKKKKNSERVYMLYSIVEMMTETLAT